MKWFKSRYTASLEHRVTTLEAQVSERDQTITELRIALAKAEAKEQLQKQRGNSPSAESANDSSKPNWTSQQEPQSPKLTSWVRTLPELENATEIKYPEN